MYHQPTNFVIIGLTTSAGNRSSLKYVREKEQPRAHYAPATTKSEKRDKYKICPTSITFHHLGQISARQQETMEQTRCRSLRMGRQSREPPKMEAAAPGVHQRCWPDMTVVRQMMEHYTSTQEQPSADAAKRQTELRCFF